MTKSYIEFRKIDEKPKTSVFAVISKSSGEELGIVKWYGPWRQYCFFPTNDTLWNHGCLGEVTGFIIGLMSARRSRRHER
ncbi:MAG: hypothetical protein KGD60_15125 [Candidatus Thorarchaeota archaeon]|nr:hypothetical protein [Candidatus Thorarchaeota archaeon]